MNCWKTLLLAGVVECGMGGNSGPSRERSSNELHPLLRSRLVVPEYETD